MLKKLNSNCSKEEFIHLEKAIFVNVLKGNAFIKTPYDYIREILSYLEDSQENVAILWDISLVILESISKNFDVINAEPVKVASSIILLAK